MGHISDDGNWGREKLTKAAVIAATGVGKTHLAAFDFRQSRHERILFLAHREVLLRDAVKTFREVMEDNAFGEIFGAGNTVLKNGRAVFAMVQTLSRTSHLEKFSPEDFDYIVMDEFHHIEEDSYRIFG
ncbi:MAG: DEAD/DEAH box helicase family protein [Desulfobacteraceae bacterium]